MKFKIEYHAEARAEARCVVGDYEAKDPDLGIQFSDILCDILDRLAEDPFLWSERDLGYRRVNLFGFPFYVAYVVLENRIVICAVAHASRDPKHFLNRLP